MRKLLALLMILLLPPLAHADNDVSEKGLYFIEGMARYNEGNFAEAIRSLGVAYETLPSVADYALIYMAKSYIHTGASEKARTLARQLHEKHSDSPLTDDARGIEVIAAIQMDGRDAIGLLEKYVADFPSDMELKYLYATLLKETGRIEEAKPFFKYIYKEACPLSPDALRELDPTDITPKDLMERGVNLMRDRRYVEAEKDLRSALRKCDESLRPGVKEKLADALFRQRKYSEASGIFIEVGDLYNAARSYIRAGQMDKFHSTMEQLVSSGHPKGANLMLAYAGDLRRKGNSEEALSLLKTVSKKYPASNEEALWATGWIYFLKSDYDKARKTFSKLYRAHKDPKYLYWEARAGEKLGRDSSKLYAKLKSDDFYEVLASLRTSNLHSKDDINGLHDIPTPEPIERVELLLKAGLRKDASRELLLRAETHRDSASLRDIALRLMEMQEYRKAMLVASTIPADMRPFEVQYPLAFWPKVMSEAEHNGIDPYLLLSLIREESRFDPEALSPAGAVGLMQLMPETAQHTAQRLNMSVDRTESLRDVDLNIKLGSYYLSSLLKQFDSVPAALAAYNAGGSRVKGWLSDNNYGDMDEFIEDIPFEETRNYVKRIVVSYFQYWRSLPAGGEVALKIL